MFRKLISHMNKSDQMSESFLLGLSLAFSGGFFDAYTYITRGKVFANAQTGNLVLMFINIINGKLLGMLKYLVPVLSFVLGVFIVYFFSKKYKDISLIHWREIVLILEIVLIFIVGIIPDKFSMYANVLISFSCAMQVQTFRTVCGLVYASTMCTGNLRSGTVALAKYIQTKKRIELERSIYYFGIIFIFGVGAGIGGIVTGFLGDKSIWITIPMLVISIIIMEFGRKKS